MKKKYIKITRSDVDGNYTITQDELLGVVEGELDGLEYLPDGTQVIMTVVEMEENEYEKLPEFQGW